jgi:hypothetical protein
MEEKVVQPEWQQLVEGVKREPVQAMIVDKSMVSPVFHLLSERKTWHNVTTEQIRELHALQLLPEHVVQFLKTQSII